MSDLTQPIVSDPDTFLKFLDLYLTILQEIRTDLPNSFIY